MHTHRHAAQLFASGNLVYGSKLATGIRPAAPTKGTAKFLGFYSTTEAATSKGRRVKVGKELANVLLLSKALFWPFC